MSLRCSCSFISAKDCGPLSAPLNGTKFGSQTTYPNKIIFSCDGGFDLRGSNVRVCIEDGTWNGEEAICEGKRLWKRFWWLLLVRIWSSKCFFLFCFYRCYIAKDCGFLKLPMNGSLLGLNLTTFPNILTFTCDKGFILRGSSVRQCQANAVWSDNETFCQGMLRGWWAEIDQVFNLNELECRSVLNQSNVVQKNVSYLSAWSLIWNLRNGWKFGELWKKQKVELFSGKRIAEDIFCTNITVTWGGW